MSLTTNLEPQMAGKLKSFQCTLCSASYLRAEHLNRHMISRHGESQSSLGPEFDGARDPTRPFQCNRCNKAFSRRDVLKRHARSHLSSLSNDDSIDETLPFTKSSVPRKATACLSCQTSKQKCDGKLPCGRCIKSKSRICSYRDGPPLPRQTSQDLASALETSPSSSISVMNSSNGLILHPLGQSQDEQEDENFPSLSALSPMPEEPLMNGPMLHSRNPAKQNGETFSTLSALLPMSMPEEPLFSHIESIDHSMSTIPPETSVHHSSELSIHDPNSLSVAALFSETVMSTDATASDRFFLDDDSNLASDFIFWLHESTMQDNEISSALDPESWAAPSLLALSQGPFGTSSNTAELFNAVSMNGLNQNLTFVTENGNSTSGERVTWLLDYDSRKSRPASPKPIDLPFASIDEDELSLSILPQVPALTIATQLKFVQRLKDVINCPYTLPNASLLNFFIQLHFDTLHKYWPLLHKATWNPNEAHWCVVLAIAASGAHYATSIPTHHLYTNVLTDICRLSLLHLTSLNDGPICELWSHQAHALIYQSLYISGTRRQLEYAEAYKSHIVTALRRSPSFREQDQVRLSEHSDVQEAWRHWIRREEHIRAAFLVLLYDTTGALFWDLEPTRLVNELSHLSLPCNDSLWDSATPLTWRAQFEGQDYPIATQTLGSFLRRALDSSKASWKSILQEMRLNPTSFTTAVLICAIHMVISTTTRMFTSIGKIISSENDINFWTFHSQNNSLRSAAIAGETFLLKLACPNPAHVENRVRKLMAAPELHTGFIIINHSCYGAFRLPLFILQSMVKAKPGSGEAVKTDRMLHLWAKAENGQLARQSAWHAAQIFGLLKTPITRLDAPIEPICLFYATIALVAFTRYYNHSWELSPPANPSDIHLDRLTSFQSPDIQAWIHAGEGRCILSNIAVLTDRTAHLQILALSAEALASMRVWNVSTHFTAVIRQYTEYLTSLS